MNLCPMACTAFLAGVDVVEILTSIPKCTIDSAMWLGAVKRSLDTFVRAFGFAWMTPKFHWMLHFHEKSQYSLNCFVLERRHRTAKRYCTDMPNTSREPSAALLNEVVCHHIASLQQPTAYDFSIGLISSRPAGQKLRRRIAFDFELDPADPTVEISVANESRFSSLATCMVNDMVLVSDANGKSVAGQVKLHAAVNGVAVSLVSLGRLAHHNVAHAYAIWQDISEGANWVDTQDILDTVVYQRLRDNRVGTILPPLHRDAL